jgi:phage-related protein
MSVMGTFLAKAIVSSKSLPDYFKAQFGDGPNNKEQSFPITYTGPKSTVQQIMEFLDRHGGAKAFKWTTPLGEVGLYTCEKAVPTPLGGGQFKLTATFDQAFLP